MSRRSSCQSTEQALEDEDVVQGRILWLPPHEEVGMWSVKRAQGKGAVDVGMYNHPVVICSRPASDNTMVHFHVITSFRGKKLNEVYGKSNAFNLGRRSWYLPVSPAPSHPDAITPEAMQRFQTLSLQGDSVLRWESYVNLRDVYQIPWTQLRSYTNSKTPWHDDYRLDDISMVRLLVRGQQVTGFRPGPQVRHTGNSASLHVPGVFSLPSNTPPPPYTSLQTSDVAIESTSRENEATRPTYTATSPLPNSSVECNGTVQSIQVTGPPRRMWEAFPPNELFKDHTCKGNYGAIHNHSLAMHDVPEPHKRSAVVEYVIQCILGWCTVLTWPWKTLKQIWRQSPGGGYMSEI